MRIFGLGPLELALCYLPLATAIIAVAVFLFLNRRKPASSQSGAVFSATPGWYADPTGTHQSRYWDGANWTGQVADAGVTAIDAMPWTGE